MNLFYPVRITMAREYAGQSKTDLANALNISPSAVAQWESGTKKPDLDNLVRMAHELRIPLSFLHKPSVFTARGFISFRATKAARLRKLHLQAERHAEMAGEALVWLREKVALPELKLPSIDHHHGEGFDAERAATECRRMMGLGDKPIHQLPELLESFGVIVSSVHFESSGFDAYSCCVAERPFIFLGRVKSRSRTRFCVAHELAHLLLHQRYCDADLQDRDLLNSIEFEANKFAGAFLMPAAEAREDLRAPSLGKLASLKAKWGVSIALMVHRARDLGLISQDRYTALCIEIGSKGWRGKKPEPNENFVPLTEGRIMNKCWGLLREHAPGVVAAVPSELPLPPDFLAVFFGVPLSELEDYSAEPKIIPFRPKHFSSEN
jgi:Zn-dependent peptidase ImmA (M78 family)/DNA-binding XRE family transcriptional regulator